MPEETQKQETSTGEQQDPYSFLAKIEGAPDKATIEAWKQLTPNGRVKMVTPDFKRVFIMRGASGLEMAKLEKEIPAGATNPQLELQYKTVAACCLYTNTTPGKKINDVDIKTSGAGLVETLFQAVTELSDYMSPQDYFRLSADL